MKFTISVPGKVILMGEHAVVHGRPAIVASVNKRLNFTLDTENLKLLGKIKSEIPIGCGMGSSAAWSVVQAASNLFLKEQFTQITPHLQKKIFDLAFQFEKIYHTNPSGVDPAICTYGGILWYKKTKSGHKIFKKLSIKRMPKFLLINTGKPEETTGEMVEMVGEELKKEKKKTNELFDCIEEQTKLFLEALEKNKRELLKNTIQNCESCLEDLGLVSEFSKNVIKEIENIGGVAKICGGGGIKKGTGFLLCYHEDPQRLLNLAKKLKLEAFRIKLGGEGVKILNEK